MSELSVVREDRDDPVDISDFGEGVKLIKEEKASRICPIFSEFCAERTRLMLSA